MIINILKIFKFKIPPEIKFDAKSNKSYNRNG